MNHCYPKDVKHPTSWWAYEIFEGRVPSLRGITAHLDGERLMVEATTGAWTVAEYGDVIVEKMGTCHVYPIEHFMHLFAVPSPDEVAAMTAAANERPDWYVEVAAAASILREIEDQPAAVVQALALLDELTAVEL